jgi:amino acid transporter
MQPRRASSVVADKMNKLAPYRIASPPPSEGRPKRLPELSAQRLAHIAVLLTYGLLLAMLAVFALSTYFGGTVSLASIAIAMGCVMVFVSAWKVFARSKQHEHSLLRGVPVCAYDLLHEWLHYGFGAIVCAGLSFMSFWFLPAFAFCIYSLGCNTMIVNASRADREDHLA